MVRYLAEFMLSTLGGGLVRVVTLLDLLYYKSCREYLWLPKMNSFYLHQTPDLSTKVKELGKASGEDAFSSYEQVDSLPFRCWIYSASSQGRAIPIFKVLMSNSCRNNCLYCASRSGRDFPRYSLKPEELAHAFAELYSSRMVEGIFLSSAIEDNPDRTMEQMIRAIELIRFQYKFRGYVHLKLMPGAKLHYVERAIELADRVSVNLEAPNQSRLSKIGPNKEFAHALKQMEYAKKLIEQGMGRARSQTTQFVLGASGESDEEILDTLNLVYENFNLRRCYFRCFHPVPDTPLEGYPPTVKWRERRLYQSDFLIRNYGFKPDEMVLDAGGNLLLNIDPKLAWVNCHPELFPVEINTAEPEELLRVPGFGPRTVSRILELRSRGKLNPGDLRRVGVPLKRAAPFLLVDGRRIDSKDCPIRLSLL